MGVNSLDLLTARDVVQPNCPVSSTRHHYVVVGAGAQAEDALEMPQEANDQRIKDFILVRVYDPCGRNDHLVIRHCIRQNLLGGGVDQPTPVSSGVYPFLEGEQAVFVQDVHDGADPLLELRDQLRVDEDSAAQNEVFAVLIPQIALKSSPDDLDGAHVHFVPLLRLLIRLRPLFLVLLPRLERHGPRDGIYCRCTAGRPAQVVRELTQFPLIWHRLSPMQERGMPPLVKGGLLVDPPPVNYSVGAVRLQVVPLCFAVGPFADPVVREKDVVFDLEGPVVQGVPARWTLDHDVV